MIWVHIQAFVCVSGYMCGTNMYGGQRTTLVLVLTLQLVEDKGLFVVHNLDGLGIPGILLSTPTIPSEHCMTNISYYDWHLHKFWGFRLKST